MDANPRFEVPPLAICASSAIASGLEQPSADSEVPGEEKVIFSTI
jgi:hypothetical protein